MSPRKNSRYQSVPRLVKRLKRALRMAAFPHHSYDLNRVFRAAEIRRHVSGFLAPWDNERLSGAEFDRSRSICEELRRVIADRMRYVEENRLDVDLCLPGGIWKGDWERSALYRGTAALLRQEYDVINNLRLFSQVFTGYSLAEMKRAEGLQPPDRVPPDLDERMKQASRRMDEWIIRYWMLSRYVPDAPRISQPRRFGEAGWIVDGHIVNHDTYLYMERIALLRVSGLLGRLEAHAADRSPLILEIGGGFGGLAFHLKNLVPRLRYIIIDLPESLVFSAIYLSTCFPDQHNVIATSPELIAKDLALPGFTFVPNHFSHRLEEAGIRVDLAINTLSMSEMPAVQVRAYCALIRDSLAPGGAFFEQNQDNRHLGLFNAEDIVAEFFKARQQPTLPVDLAYGSSPNVWSGVKGVKSR